MPRYSYTQESGEDFRVVSPDKADALGMTFAPAANTAGAFR